MAKIITFILPILGGLCALFHVSAGDRVDLRLSFRNLPELDPFGGDPEPYATVYYSRVKGDPFGRVGQTKYLEDTTEGTFPEIFFVDYQSVNSEQRLKIDMNDQDYNEDDDIGFAEFSLAEIMNSKGLEVEKALTPIGNGYLKVSAVYSNVTTGTKSKVEYGVIKE